MSIPNTVQLAGQVRDPAVNQELQQLIAQIQVIAQWGQWTQIPYTALSFWPDAGTWTPKAGDVRLFQWTVIGSTMFVQFHIQNGAASGTVKQLFMRINSGLGYKIVPAPNAAVPVLAGLNLGATSRCGLWQNTNTYASGVVAPFNDQTGRVTLVSFLDATSQINTVANAGCFGTAIFNVQPSA